MAPKKYKKYISAFNKARKYIEENDDRVLAIEIHGPHSGFRIEFNGVGYTSTEIEK